VAIVVFGENPYAEWHGDIGTLDFHGADGNPAPNLGQPWPETPLPGQWAPPVSAPALDGDDPNVQLMQRLRQEGVPVVAVFLAGRPRGVTPEIDAANAFVVAWLPGTEGEGVADVLFRNNKGGVNFDFTGRLSYTWPVTGVPDPTHPYANPLFAYGYGLSYCNRHCDAPLSQEHGKRNNH
jgi:beta-glucosidase